MRFLTLHLPYWLLLVRTGVGGLQVQSGVVVLVQNYLQELQYAELLRALHHVLGGVMHADGFAQYRMWLYWLLHLLQTF